MSLLEIVGSILTELEKVHHKLDMLLARPFKFVEKEKARIDILEIAKEVEKEIGVSADVIEALLPEAIKEEFDDTPIIWVKRNGMKFKACKYKCGNYVGWDNTAKKYLHYDAEFKLIGHDCPKYANPEVEF